MKRISKTVFYILLAASTLSAQTIRGAGASFPKNVYFKWSKEYNKATGIKIDYSSIGSGGGIKNISKRIVQFGASDKPLKLKKLKKNNLQQFPMLVGAIVLAYNIPGVGELKLTGQNVADIFMGKIIKWNDPKLAKNNTHVQLPNKSIIVVRRSDGSGTTFNFTKYLSSVSSTWGKKIGTGKTVNWWSKSTGAKGNEGVSNAIKNFSYSIGYVGFDYAQQQKLPSATIKNKEGHWVKASIESIQEAAHNAKWNPKKGFYLTLENQAGKSSYPIVAATFILLPMEKVQSNKEVVKFLDFAYKNGDQWAFNIGLVALPNDTKELVRKAWKKAGFYTRN